VTCVETERVCVGVVQPFYERLRGEHPATGGARFDARRLVQVAIGSQDAAEGRLILSK
jgi:hypothetical protein